MICHKRRCIFVHQRKCAGVSIMAAFGYVEMTPETDFANHGVLSPEWTEYPELISNYFKFAVVRNPWDRFVSGWRYCQSTRQRPLVDVLRDPPRDGHDYRHVTQTQSATLFYPDGRLAVDHLLRFETLEADFADLARRLGMGDVTLPRYNLGTHEDYHAVFDDEARTLFQPMFAEDIEHFGYRF